MRALVIKFGCFICLFISLFWLLSFLLDKRINVSENFYVQKNVRVIMFGHSQAACSYNDSLIISFKNYAASMEGYFYTYYKMKKVIESNPHIKTVFVEFTNNQFTKFADNRIWGEYMPSLLSKSLPLIDYRGMFLLFKKSPLKVTQVYTSSQKRKLRYLIEGNGNYFVENNMVGYIKRVGAFKQQKIDSIISQNKNITKNSKSYSMDNLFYLKKIVELCKESKVNIYFIRSPLPPFNKLQNDSLFHAIRKKEFNNIPFIDLKDYPLLNEDFNDNLHLNFNGSVKISRFMNRFIDSKVFECDTFKKWIDNDIIKQANLN